MQTNKFVTLQHLTAVPGKKSPKGMGYIKIMKYIVFPANKSGKIMKGFCPTICSSEKEAKREMDLMTLTYINNSVNYHHIELQHIK